MKVSTLIANNLGYTCERSVTYLLNASFTACARGVVGRPINRESCLLSSNRSLLAAPGTELV